MGRAAPIELGDDLGGAGRPSRIWYGFKGMIISARQMGKELKIDGGTVSQTIDRMSKWCFLTKKIVPGRALWIHLNRRNINDA